MGNLLCCGRDNRELGYVVSPGASHGGAVTAPSARVGARSARTPAEVRAEWKAVPGDKETRLRQANEKFNREKIKAFEEIPDPVPRNRLVAQLLEELRVDIRMISTLAEEERRAELARKQKSLGRHLGRASDLIEAIDAPDGPPLYDEELVAAKKRPEDFSFVGQRFKAKVFDVYDGDTVRCMFRYKGELVQYMVRMVGYDSPEMKPPKNKPNRDAEIRAAKAARDALERRIAEDPHRMVFIECVRTKVKDPYKRPLVRMYLLDGPKLDQNGECLNDWMLAKGYGVPYNGGTKKDFVPPEEDQTS